MGAGPAAELVEVNSMALEYVVVVVVVASSVFVTGTVVTAFSKAPRVTTEVLAVTVFVTVSPW